MSGFMANLPRPTRRQFRALLALGIVALLALLLFTLSSSLLREQPGAGQETGGRRPLPDDVEGVLTRFSYSEVDQEVRIKISGKRVVRRGRRLLGLRSNLVKTNFIEELQGTVTTPKGTTTFSAAQAEWDAEPSRPLLLKKGVSLTVPGQHIAPVQQARIYLKRGVIQVDGARSYLIR